MQSHNNIKQLIDIPYSKFNEIANTKHFYKRAYPSCSDIQGI